MPKQYRFRLIYVICEDNRLIEPFEMVNIYKRRSYAESVCKSKQQYEEAESKMQYRINDRRVSQHKVHGFYLVHESLFDEILKKYSK
jgi:hypothetical protein